MMQHNGSPFSLEQNSFMDLMPKRLKADVPLSSKIVSPYGKTDTASVLLEAMEYIRFLYEQLQVLIAPYLCGKPTTETQEVDPCSSLRAKGLSLVPISLVDGVSSSNGADIWAPIKTNPSNSIRLNSDEETVITGPS